ncbi:MAG: GNAT family N-acetyltransferase [Aggregatilineaceae bacterium]
MLVKLYDLPPLEPALARLQAERIAVRRALAAERHVIARWVGEHFWPHWRSECEVAFCRQPISCYVAVRGSDVLGFACYDVTRRGFFGPMGVAEEVRGRGVGKALFLACLHSMWIEGYGYAIIGGVGPVEFYRQAAGAIEIPDSTPGVYRGLLTEERSRSTDSRGAS